MKSIYIIYIKIDEDTFNIFKYIIPNVHDFKWRDDNFYGMYAWTTSKSKLSEFLEIREKSIFNISKKEIDDEEYKMFKSHYHLLELKRYDYNSNRTNKDEYVKVVTTKNEKIEVQDNGSENYNEFGPAVSSLFNYKIFKKDIIQALDIVGYTGLYDVNYGNLDYMDAANYNKSYGLTPLGNSILTNPSDLSLLVYLFYYTFYGKNKISERNG